MAWAGSDSIPCYYIGRRLRRAGIVVTDMKSKYGTWRIYCHFHISSVHDITHNGYSYIQYKGPLLWLYYKTLSLQMLLFKPINWILYPLQKKWYRQAYKMALRKFPDQAEAILMGADWTELLVGLDPRLVREEEDGIMYIRWDDSKDMVQD